MTVLHHRNLTEDAPGIWRPLRPARDTSLWHRWKRERACRREIGHCWHPEPETMIEWFCCACGRPEEGMPAQECVYCRAAQPTAGKAP